MKIEQDDEARLISIAEFAYNNGNNASINCMPFELNCSYHSWVSYKNDNDSYSRSKTGEKLLSELYKLITVDRKNVHHAQAFQKKSFDKYVKLKRYASGDIVWLNSKYIKTRRNCKLESKFFGSFQVLYPVKSQVYKLELPKKCSIYNIFHILLLEQDITRKKQMLNNIAKLDVDNSKRYKIEAIQDHKIYSRE